MYLYPYLTIDMSAVSGDLRDVVKSIADLPHTYQHKCAVEINELDEAIVARNVIFLLIIIRFDSYLAAEMILHLWYSAMLPRQLLETLRAILQPLFDEVYSEIRADPTKAVVTKTWGHKSCTVRLSLPRDQWIYLHSCLQLPGWFTAEHAYYFRVSMTFSQENRDYLDRTLSNFPMEWRLSKVKYREHGVLLPFGSNREDFDTPNP